MLWHLQHSLLAKNWINKSLEFEQPAQALNSSIRNFLRQGLIPANLPPFIRPAHEGLTQGISRFYVEQGPLTPFWTLYLREDVKDRRALFARTKKIIGINRSGTEINPLGGISKDLLAQKFERYLLQHPYVQVLKINDFNPGDAALLVEAILKIEKGRINSGFSNLRYEIRLFTQGSIVDEIGESIDNLINPERQVSPEADAFSIPSQNHLFPKLRLYRNSLDEFLDQPEAYQANITILQDIFPISIDIQPLLHGRSSFLHGLIQDQITEFGSEEMADYAWRKQLLPTSCMGMVEHDQISTELAELLNRLALLQASVAVSKKIENASPTLNLKLSLEYKSLLNLVHESSDWVFIIDRNIGLEYFDSSTVRGRPIYLLDFIPEFANVDADHLFLTTQLTDEITSLVLPTLADRKLDKGDGVDIFFLKLLRSLSGRLALKLLSTPNDVSGVLGLALGRLFLEQFGLLEDCIVIPLDSHIDLFTQADLDNLALEEVTFKRSDLLLINCDAESRQLNFHVIEVKLRSDLGDLSAYLSLRQQIDSQLTATVNSLRSHYDPELKSKDRLDRQLKTRQLISLLTFYLDRSERYGLIARDEKSIFTNFINSLDNGYQLTCSGIGLIFDFGFDDLAKDEEHAGLVFYRVGRNYIDRMVDLGLRREALLEKTNIIPVSIVESQQVEKEREKVFSETDMRKDTNYHDVRTTFRTPTGRSVSLKPIKKLVAPEEKEIVQPPQVEHPQKPAAPIIKPEEKPADELPKSKDLTSQQKVEQEIIPREENMDVGPSFDILLGESTESRQFGILGKSSGKLVALDLNGTNTISLFGVQGGGKSYTVGMIVEMATQQYKGINILPKPLATVIFHYHESQDYPPEFVSMIKPNDKEEELEILAREYGVNPARLDDVLILTSADKLAERKKEFPGVPVEPISFSSSELSIKDWRFLMGVGGNQMYMKQINMIMRQLRDDVTLDTLREQVENSDLSDQQKTIANIRLDFASQFIDDNHKLTKFIKPGRLIVVDLRDELIEKDEALELFVVMLSIFANAGRDDNFNKLIVFDEAHKYMDNPDLTTHIVDAIRQMRHQGVSIVIASQDPPSLPNAIIELSSVVVLHRFNAPQWLKHVQKSITALAELTPAQLASLNPGEAFVWSSKATEKLFTQRAMKLRFRPRLTRHGGGTKSAISE